MQMQPDLGNKIEQSHEHKKGLVEKSRTAEEEKAEKMVGLNVIKMHGIQVRHQEVSKVMQLILFL